MGSGFYVISYHTKSVSPFYGRRIIKAESWEAARDHFFKTYGEEQEQKFGVIIDSINDFDEAFPN